MSIAIMTRVWADSKAQGSALLVLLAIADFANDRGEAFPSIETLAKKARMSPRNVRYTLDSLQASGELMIERNQGPRGCNIFRVAANLAGGVQSIQPETGFPAGVQPASGGAAIAVAPEPSLTVNEPSTLGGTAPKATSRQAHVYSVDFLEAWNLYPKRDGDNPKPDAFRAWKARLKEGHLATELTDGVRRYRAHCEAKGSFGTEYVMQAKRFFGTGKAFLTAWSIGASAQRKGMAGDVNLAATDYAADVPAGRA